MTSSWLPEIQERGQSGSHPELWLAGEAGRRSGAPPGSLPLLPLQHQAQADLHRPLHQGGEAVGGPPGGENQQLRPPRREVPADTRRFGQYGRTQEGGCRASLSP